MPKGPLEEWLRKPVVVRANGISYRGLLIEVGGDEIILRRETAYVSIPMDRIVSVEGPQPHKRKGPLKTIDPSFFQATEKPSVKD